MIIVFGSLNIDVVMPVGHFPKPGETVLCAADYLSRPGGKGANQALAAARAGAKVAMVGMVGDDSFGRRCVNNLKHQGVMVSGVAISERPTGCATIAVDMQGENFVIVAPGANLDAKSDQAPDEIFTPKNIILTQMEVTPQETFSVLARARGRGAVTILNPSPAGKLPPETLKSVDYLIVNEVEVLQLAHHLGIAGAAPALLAKAIARFGNLACIVTLGDKGSVAARKDVLFAVSSLPAEVVDTTGAGDTFCGVFAASLQAGHDWLKALHRASVGAGLSCLGLGAQDGMPLREDIEKNLAKVAPPHKIG
jgi:ribokinase